MSLHKAIEHNKERRKPWPYEKSVDSWCQNHGRCRRCFSNRTAQARKLAAAAQEEERELQ